MNEKDSPLTEVPEEARFAVKNIIGKPRFLARLLIEEAERLEAYAKLPENEESYSQNYDAWGNCITVSDDCEGKAKLYRRIVDVISPKK